MTGEACVETGVALAPMWQHVALVWDGTTKTVYRDAVAIGSAPAARPIFDASPFVIGSDDENGVPKGFFSGSLDDLRIYDRALGPAEIAALRDLR